MREIGGSAFLMELDRRVSLLLSKVGKAAMSRFEYLHNYIERAEEYSCESVEAELDELGEDGWELVNMTPGWSWTCETIEVEHRYGDGIEFDGGYLSRLPMPFQTTLLAGIAPSKGPWPDHRCQSFLSSMGFSAVHMLCTIRQVTLELNYALRLTHDDGQIVVVNFKPVIRRGGVFAALGDPHFFSQVSIGESGRYIQWPGGLDFCADALWYEGQADNS